MKNNLNLKNKVEIFRKKLRKKYHKNNLQNYREKKMQNKDSFDIIEIELKNYFLEMQREFLDFKNNIKLKNKEFLLKELKNILNNIYSLNKNHQKKYIKFLVKEHIEKFLLEILEKKISKNILEKNISSSENNVNILKEKIIEKNLIKIRTILEEENDESKIFKEKINEKNLEFLEEKNIEENLIEIILEIFLIFSTEYINEKKIEDLKIIEKFEKFIYLKNKKILEIVN